MSTILSTVRMTEKNRPTVLLTLRITGVVAVFALVVLFSYWYHSNSGELPGIFFRFKHFFYVPRLRDFILSFGAYSQVVFVIIQALQVLFAPVPGEVTGFVGGFLYGKVIGTLLSTLGLAVGSVIAFEVTRVFGRRLVSKVVRQEAMARFDHFVTHRGLHIAFVLFLIPGFPKDSLCYLLGLTHMRRLDFILMNVFGRLPGTLILTFQGEALRTHRYHEFFTLLVGSVLLTAVLYFLRNGIIHFFSHLIAPLLHRFRRQ
jgi:uncharacterized membrane protein YdjX (TVP38/TMEM64 family)